MSNNNSNNGRVWSDGVRLWVGRSSYDIGITEDLNLADENLSRFPRAISYFEDLQTLNLDKNNLTRIPESIGNLTTSLVELSVNENKLTSLPESIGNLRKLESLELKENKLTQLPESIGNLRNLKGLALSGNKLTSLPESIGNLKNLTALALSRNKLTKLPESIGNLKNLRYIALSGNKLTSLPRSFKNLKNVRIHYRESEYNVETFIKLFNPKRVSKNTELFNKSIGKTNTISNVPKNKRVYININSNVKNNGELRRLYNKNGINEYMRGRREGRLHGGSFTMNNITKLKNTNIVNRNVYLRNIKVRLKNSTINNFTSTVNKIKGNLPSNINRTDVNTIIRSLKEEILKKIFNKLKNTPSNNRLRIMNNMKNKGLMNNSDVNVMKKKLMSSNFVRNSKKSPPTTKVVGKMNSNNVRKSPYI